MDVQWLLWLAIALAAGVAEVLTLSLVFAMVAGGAVAAAVVAGLTGNVVLSVLAFAASTGLLMVAARPPLLRLVERAGPAEISGTAALVGSQARVTRAVSAGAGEVKLAGEIWSARAQSPAVVLETGSLVIVERIDGATALVRAALHDPAALPGGENPTDGPES